LQRSSFFKFQIHELNDLQMVNLNLIFFLQEVQVQYILQS